MYNEQDCEQEQEHEDKGVKARRIVKEIKKSIYKLHDKTKQAIQKKGSRNIFFMLYKIILLCFFLNLGIYYSTNGLSVNAGDMLNRIIVFLFDPRLPMLLFKLIMTTISISIFATDNVITLYTCSLIFLILAIIVSFRFIHVKVEELVSIFVELYNDINKHIQNIQNQL